MIASKHTFLGIAFVSVLSATASSQSNANPGIDVELGILGEIESVGRQGTFPNGMNAAAMSTTVCNQGDEVNWFQAMNPDHPFIAFLVARESNGRFEQISNRSYLKHGFFALASSQCTPCTPPSQFGAILGEGCSDTYGVSNNSDDFWLAPAEEVDPWLGLWDPVCSFFDLGTGNVVIPDDCDGNRTFTQSQANGLGPLGNRIHLSDADLNVAGASYYYQAQYVVATEPEVERNDNLGSRPFTPVFNGSDWDLNESSSVLLGPIMRNWSGATTFSNANGTDDGRFWVGSKVTGPTNGMYHYEILVHNRDNSRGMDELRIPVCGGARVQNVGFRDIDGSAGNDWTSSLESGGTELVFTDPSGANALRWNTMYNFWFDSDAGPLTAGLTLNQADPGPGASFVGVSSEAPLELYNVFTGPGCALGAVPTLYATGTPARASLGNATFGLVSSGNVPGELNILAASDVQSSGAIAFGPCTLWLPGTVDDIYGFASAFVDGNGDATYSIPVPNNIALEGLSANFQAIGINPAGGATFSVFEFSDGLRVRIGDSIASCE